MSRTACRVSIAILLILFVAKLQAESNSGASTASGTASSQNSLLDDRMEIEQGRSTATSTQAADPLDRPLKLDQKGGTHQAESSQTRAPAIGLATSTIVGGLAICLGIFLLVVLLTRRKSPNKFGPLPTEVVESLGRMTLNHRQQLQLIRLGRKLVLLSVTPQGANSVAEIDDPDEATRLAGLCQQDRPNSVTATFREVLGKYSHEDDTRDRAEYAAPAEHESRGAILRVRRPTREGFHG